MQSNKGPPQNLVRALERARSDWEVEHVVAI